MYRLFTPVHPTVKVIDNPDMLRIRANITSHYEHQQLYYNRFIIGVSANHILVRLAYALIPYINQDMDTYRLVTERVHSLCAHLGITSTNTRGTVHPHAFYSEQCFLIHASYDDQNPYLQPRLDWETIRPVRPITHRLTSLEVLLPPTHTAKFSPGFAAVAIDIPLFAYQLKQWDIRNESLPLIQQEGIGAFISGYVLPGMVKDHMDIAWRNRIVALKNHTMIPPVKERSFCVSYSLALVRPLFRILKRIAATRQRYVNAMVEIPAIFTESYLQAVPVEIATMSLYSYHVVFCVFMDWFLPISEIIESDQRTITDIRKILVRVDRYVTNSGALSQLPADIQTEYVNKFNNLKTKYI